MSADPSMAGGDPSADPTASAGGDSDEGGYCIEIKVYPDGHFTVSKESLDEENSEEGGESADPAAAGAPGAAGGGGGGGDADEGEQTADNISDALKMVLAIYKEESSGAEDDAFDSGFGGKPMTGKGAKPGMGM
jgi:hypothetical protein